jgi:hypothetical protein
MRIFSMVKADGCSEAGERPDPSVFAAMAKLSEESIKRGVLLDQGGLVASAHGARVTFVNGKPTVTDGPFAETKELVAGYAVLRVKDLEEGIAEAKKLPIKAEIELRPMIDVEDFSPEIQAVIDNENKFRARPPVPNGKPRFMLLFEAGVEMTEPPTVEMVQAMGRFNDALIAANMLLAGEGLQPTAAGARVNLETGQVTRGPFSGKYTLTGYWMIQADSKAEAIEWAKRVPIPSGTIEVRPVMGFQH